MTQPAGVASPALAVREVVKRYGSLTVVDGVSFTVGVGEALGIVGPNGAGKTTLLDLIAGAQRGDSGRVLLGGVDVTRLGPARRCRHGLARTFQTPRPLGDLTVFETALVSAVRGGGLRGRQAHESAYAALARTGTLRLANQASASLRLLDRKQLELARALAADPRVLLLDEIAGGLTDAETARLVETIHQVHDGGTTIVWVEHVLRALTKVATRLICLADGRVLADGVPQDVLANGDVRMAYLGRSVR